MSYDLAVWHSEVSITQAQAAVIAGNNEAPWVPTRTEQQTLDAFVHELTLFYPPAENENENGWSYDCSLGGRVLWINLSGSRTMTTVGSAIVELCSKHGLVCYFPSEAQVLLPPTLTAKPTWKQRLKRIFG